MKRYLGIDIGGTKCAVTLGAEDPEDGEMRVLRKSRFETPKQAPAETLELLAAAVEKFLRESPAESIGISCGGPLDSSEGVILGPPNLPGWDRVEIVRFFEERFGLRTRLQNDANACAAAEWKYGAGKGLHDLVFLTFGTGLGAGLILNGRLYNGANDMAGEAGHWRMSDAGPVGYGKAGSFEGFCSGGGIALAAREKVRQAPDSALFPFADTPERIDAKLIADLADAGDGFCRGIYADCGRMLGRGLALLIDLLNPQAIILGSVFVRSRNLLWPYAEAEIKAEALARSAAACRILPARLGDSLGDIAALTIAAAD